MWRRHVGLTALLAAVTLVLAALLPTTAAAATGTYLRLAHLSPDIPNVDVTIRSTAGPTS